MKAKSESETSSIENKLTVLVLATGLVKVEDYVKDYNLVAEKAQEGIIGIEAMLGGKVDSVLTRGSATLQERFEENLDCEVESARFGWIGFLNDTEEEDEYGKQVVPAVREEGQPKVDTSSFIDLDDLDENRKNRAKSKSGAKMNHYLFDDYYDKYPTVDAVITLNCGSHRGLNEIKDARGANKWVVGRAGHVEKLIDINVQDQILYSRLIIDNSELEASDLHDSQIQELRQELTEEELAEYNIPPLVDETGPNKATAN